MKTKKKKYLKFGTDFFTAEMVRRFPCYMFYGKKAPRRYRELESLEGATAKDIVNLMLLGHPDEHGVPYSRTQVMEEIERRGFDILRELNYPTKKNSQYVNMHTGDKETLMRVLGDFGLHSLAVKKDRKKQIFHLLEHWVPYDESTDSLYTAHLYQNVAGCALAVYGAELQKDKMNANMLKKSLQSYLKDLHEHLHNKHR